MANPVRVLMVITVRFGKNGITNCVMNYVSRLDPARVRCDLVCPNEPGKEAREAIGRTGGEVFVLPGRNKRPLAYMRALTKIVSARGEEIMHAHGNSATLAAELLAAKRGGASIRLPHSHNTTCKMKLADRLLRGAFYRLSTGAVACSAAAGDWLFPDRPREVLNNAVDAERFRYNEAARVRTRESLGIAPEEFVFLHVGTFNAQKNQAFLIEAFAQLAETRAERRLFLVGDGERRPAAEARAEALGLRNRVEFLGLRDDIPALLSAADAFVLPSLHEGLPLTLVEAQCAGLPCVVSDRVTPEAAMTNLVSFAPIERADVYAKALANVEQAARETASGEAIHRVREAGYDVSQNAEALMRLYERLARN